MSVKDPSNRLSSFEDVVDAFKKFSDGGFWVKKIIQRMGIFRETVVGPYTKKEASELAERWKKIFKYEDQDVAKVLTFSDLVCSGSPSKLGEYKWNPPKGSGMICILKEYYPLVVYSNKIVTDPSFTKFYEYCYPEGIRSKAVGEYFIIYNRYSTSSYRRKSAMEQFIKYDIKHYDDEQKKWLINKISGKQGNDEHKPNMIPGYIDRLEKECNPIGISFFKEFYPDQKSKKNNKVLSKAYNKMKKCASEDNKTFFFYQDVRFESVESDLLIEDKILNYGDDQSPEKIRKTMKKIVIEKSSIGKFNILLTNYQGDFSVGIYAIKDGQGRMIVSLPNSDFEPLKEKETMFISRNLRRRKYFTKMDINGAILLYIAKCLGVKKVWIEDQKTGECSCEASDISSFINPVRFLADQPSIYANLGFINEEQQKLEQMIELYKQQDIPVTDPDYNTPGYIDQEDYDSSSSIEILEQDYESDSSNLPETMNLADLAVMYLSKDCTYQNLCDIMWIVTEDIYQRISNKYWLDMDSVDLDYYKGFF